MLTFCIGQKLQRRIANSRGIAPDASLVSPTQPTVEEQRIQDQQRADAPKLDPRDAGVVAITKRKYRRHPKVSILPPPPLPGDAQVVVCVTDPSPLG